MGQVVNILRVWRKMKHKNLASERVRVGLNQHQLAEALSVSYATINEYENFKRPMSLSFVADAADFFGCSIDYLLDRTDERVPQIT